MFQLSFYWLYRASYDTYLFLFWIYFSSTPVLRSALHNINKLWPLEYNSWLYSLNITVDNDHSSPKRVREISYCVGKGVRTFWSPSSSQSHESFKCIYSFPNHSQSIMASMAQSFWHSHSHTILEITLPVLPIKFNSKTKGSFSNIKILWRTIPNQMLIITQSRVDVFEY